MITKCKKCGSKNLYLEPRIKGQDISTADMVALKCRDCGAWLKWCPKNERASYLKIQDDLGQIGQDSKWQKLKEWLKNQITDLRHIDIKTEKQSLRINDAVNCFKQVLNKMQELEGENAES